MERPQNNNLNFGLDLQKHEIEKARPENYVFGAVADKVVLQPDGKWLDFSPECEIQKTDYDDLMDCVTESSINWEKIILKKKFNLDLNLSQRFRAKKSGTTRSGNSLYAVADSARKDGFVLEADWPRDRSMDWNTYYSSVPSSVVNKGLKSVAEFDVNYERVPVNRSALQDALKYGPIQVIGYAWASENGIYYDYGYTPNHAFLLVGYKPNGNWLVYDSYPTDFIIDNNSTKQEFLKELDKDFHFGDAMLYSIKLKTATDQKCWLYKIINMLKNFYRDKVSGKFYFVKSVNNKPMKQEITSINGILTILDVNFGAKQTGWGELGQYPDNHFFN